MAEEYTYKPEDMERYQYGELAGRFYQSEEGKPFVLGALEKLINRLGKEKNQDAADSTRIAIKHGGIEDIIGVYSGKYQKALSSVSVGEYLKKEGTDLKLLKENFGEFFDKKYENIREKIDTAKYVIDGIKEGKYKFPEGELEKKKDDIKKYGGIYLLIETMENAKFEALRNKVASGNFEESISEISKDPMKYVKAAFAKYL